MNNFRRFFVLVIALPGLMYGRLGETERELIARFGEPSWRGSETINTQGKMIEIGSRLSFKQGDWFITCALIEGRSAKEFYSKSGEWTEDQFLTVLTSNSQGERWTDKSNNVVRKLAREWHREDGGSAVWHMGVYMEVTNPSYQRAEERAEAKAKADASQIPNL